MPNPRRAVQEAHERFNVDLLIDTLNKRHRSKHKVISEPNPPEAIIRSGKTTRWVEVVTVFWNSDFAKDLYSYATEGEDHKPIGDGVFTNVTHEFANSFVTAVQNKLEKATYEPFRNAYGPGYLLVSIQFPFFGKDAFDFIYREWCKREFQDRGCFRSIYLAYRVFDGYRVTKWQPPA